MAGKYLAPRTPGCRPKGGNPIREKQRTIITISLAVLFFLLALGLTVYPVFSNRYNEAHQSLIHTEYRNAVQALVYPCDLHPLWCQHPQAFGARTPDFLHPGEHG